ncbi:MAG TPA: TM0106 family RecB-like putative nuclease, partial [Candidatus Limnocylindrales bacterium]
MQVIDGVTILSATDLVGFLACEHLAGLELAGASGLVERPIRKDPELELIQARGYEHERRYRDELAAGGRRVTEIALDGSIADRLDQLRAAAAETDVAMRRGDDVIYQATFFDGRWRGHADFLLRVEEPSDLGPWSYEIADTKLARHVKASALLQVCSYVEQLARTQGREPERMHIALGGKARATESFRVADHMAYYRLVKRLFEDRIAGTAAYPPVGTYPDPVEHCDVCRWDELCTIRRRADDDLSLVAGITSLQRRQLKDRGIATRRGLAGLTLPLVPPLRRGNPTSLERIRSQARIQVRGTDEARMLYELVDPPRLRDGTLEPDRGLLSLPEPRAGDLFFDIEGDPYAFDEGIDYLFGVLEPGRPSADGSPAFHALWARDEGGEVTEDAERRAFERLVDLLIERLDADPEMHVYHYAPYEPTALVRLMGRHGTRENEVDRLLRGGILVDLFRVVRQGVRASVESYSIKRLEPLYGYEREIGLRDAGSSIVAFETWLGGGTGEHGEETLATIERYNRDDVVSTMRLRAWLEARRTELEGRLGQRLPRRSRRDGAPAEVLGEKLARIAATAGRLAPAGVDDGTEAGHARWLLAQLLWFHRREDKSFWRRYYELMGDMT